MGLYVPLNPLKLLKATMGLYAPALNTFKKTLKARIALNTLLNTLKNDFAGHDGLICPNLNTLKNTFKGYDGLIRPPPEHYRVNSRAAVRAVPCRVVSRRAVPCRAVPRRAVPCRAAPCHAVPCRAVP